MISPPIETPGRTAVRRPGTAAVRPFLPGPVTYEVTRRDDQVVRSW